MKSLEANPHNRYRTALDFGLALAESLGPDTLAKLQPVLQ